MSSSRSPTEVLEFWFSERAKPLWFEKNAAFDAEIRARFGDLVVAACDGELDSWSQTPESALALVLLLDQFTRNIYRGTPRAFSGDVRARAAAAAAIDRGFERQTPLDRRHFFYVPFEHGENVDDQRRSVALFHAWAEAHDGARREEAMSYMKYIYRHQEIIERFGRFPHRNAILGRESTAEELAFLTEPHSSF